MLKPLQQPPPYQEHHLSRHCRMSSYLEQTIGAFVRTTNASGMAIDYLFLDGGSRYSTYVRCCLPAPARAALRCAST
jgi:hypothetical protein